MSKLVLLSAVKKYYTPKFRQFLIDLGQVASTINIVEMVTPVNANEEKAKWLGSVAQGQWRNPCFCYNSDLLSRIAGLMTDLNDLSDRMTPALESVSNDSVGCALRELAESRYRETERAIAMAVHILNGLDVATGIDSELIYGYPDKIAITETSRYSNLLAAGFGKDQRDDSNLRNIRQCLQELKFDAKQIREYFIWMAERYGFADTRPMEVSDVTTSIDVRDKSSCGPVVTIPTDRKVDGLKLVELTRHEILCHWGDSERAASALPLLGGGALKPADEVLYEGHATLTDYYTHLYLGDEAPQQSSPFYIMAMVQAKCGSSFVETAKYIHSQAIRHGMSDSAVAARAWMTCLRVFRGSRGNQDNSQVSYAFTKDRAYFEGRLIAEKLHADGLDSILKVSTLSLADIETLKTAVEFEKGDEDQATMLLDMWAIIQQMIGGRF